MNDDEDDDDVVLVVVEDDGATAATKVPLRIACSAIRSAFRASSRRLAASLTCALLLASSSLTTGSIADMASSFLPRVIALVGRFMSSEVNLGRGEERSILLGIAGGENDGLAAVRSKVLLNIVGALSSCTGMMFVRDPNLRWLVRVSRSLRRSDGSVPICGETERGNSGDSTGGCGFLFESASARARAKRRDVDET